MISSSRSSRSHGGQPEPARRQDRRHPQADEHTLVTVVGEPERDGEQERAERGEEEQRTPKRCLSMTLSLRRAASGARATRRPRARRTR